MKRKTRDATAAEAVTRCITEPRTDGSAAGIEKTHARDCTTIAGVVADLLESDEIKHDAAAVVAITIAWRVGFVRGLQAEGAEEEPIQ